MTKYNEKLELPNLYKEWDRCIQQGIGKGEKGLYRPYLTVQNFHSSAKRCRIPYKRLNRMFHLMSMSELLCFYTLDWQDNIYDIKEQYPLNPQLSVSVARDLNYNHPGFTKGGMLMTTDLLATFIDKNMRPYNVAYQVKYDDELSERTLEKISIEEEYWRRKSVKFKLVVAKDLNRILCNNLNLLFNYRNTSLPQQDFYHMLKLITEFRKQEPKIMFSSLHYDLGVLPVSGIHVNIQQAIKFLCAHKYMHFDIENTALIDCSLGEMEVA